MKKMNILVPGSDGREAAIVNYRRPEGHRLVTARRVERCRYGLYRNMEESSSYPFFSGAVEYFR